MRASYSSAIITKLYSTSTFHWNTARNSLHPSSTIWALFKFCTSNKLLKFFICLTRRFFYYILSTGHSTVIVTFAFQTILFFTNRTFIFGQSTIVCKYCCAVCSWTPCSIFILFFYIIIKSIFLILLPHLSINKLQNFICLHKRLTSRRTWYLYFFLINIRFYMLIYAFIMKIMSTFQLTFFIFLNLLLTNLAY
jgi:hypothetical protein